jgi:putative FmdB family regulatory protein
MPTYEYACEACGNQWEEIQRITEAPTEVCPKCSKSAAHRLISAGTGFILKGGGWYSDLYSSAKPAANKTESNGTTSSDAGAKPSVPAAAPTTETATKSEPKAPATTPPTSTPAS